MTNQSITWFISFVVFVFAMVVYCLVRVFAFFIHTSWQSYHSIFPFWSTMYTHTHTHHTPSNVEWHVFKTLSTRRCRLFFSLMFAIWCCANANEEKKNVYLQLPDRIWHCTIIQYLSCICTIFVLFFQPVWWWRPNDTRVILVASNYRIHTILSPQRLTIITAIVYPSPEFRFGYTSAWFFLSHQ